MFLKFLGYIIFVILGLGIAIYIPIFSFREKEGKPLQILGAVVLGLAIAGFSLSEAWSIIINWLK
jgi:hypothetical protein